MGRKRVLLVLGVVLILFIVVFVSARIGVEDIKKINKIDKQIYSSLEKDDSVKVIVKMKDLNSLSSENLQKETLSSLSNITNEYSSFNGFSATITSEELSKLSLNSEVESIQIDKPVQAFLQDSTELIEAKDIWTKQIAGINLTGEGESICVIDTGIDYTHPDFGSCNNIYTNSSQEVELEKPFNFSHSPNYTERNACWYIDYALDLPSHEGVQLSISNSTLYKGDSLYLLIEKEGYFSSMKEINLSLGWTPFMYSDLPTLGICFGNEIGERNFKISSAKLYSNFSSNCSKVIGGRDFVNGDIDPKDDHGHGTHVSGIIGANGGIKGVAPNSKIVSVKALDNQGGGFTSDIIAGIDWCTENKERYNISVISMSLGADCTKFPQYCYNSFCDQYDVNSGERDAINSAIAKNISVVVATGNNGNSTHISSPACIQNVTRVGSTNKSDIMSGFSNRWSLDMLVAPGTEINSTNKTGEYILMSGTSMAAPHVAGAIAIINQFLKLRRISKTPKEIENLLNKTGKQIEDSHSGKNYSRIDVYSAIEFLCIENTLPSNITILNNISKCEKNDSAQFNFSAIKRGINDCEFIGDRIVYFQNESYCDFCTPNWTKINFSDGFWFNDTNNCYNQTNLISDLIGKPKTIKFNITENLTEFLNNETNKSLLELNFNFSNHSTEFSELAILSEEDDSSFAYTLIRGLNLSLDDNLSKIVYLNNISSTGMICIKDAEIENISEVSDYCNSSNEILFLSCPLKRENYSCEIEEDGRYKIFGLSHSAVKEHLAICGDGICSSNENCSSCSLDCGSCPISPKGGSSGGGGGSPPSGNTELKVDDVSLQKGYNKNFNINEKLSFAINNQNHSIQLNKIINDSINITIRSEPINLILKIGEEEKLNLTSSEYYDLLVKLEGIGGNKANITIKKINERINSFNLIKYENNKSDEKKYYINEEGRLEMEENQDNSNFLWSHLISIPILILIIIIIIYFFRRNRSSKTQLFYEKRELELIQSEVENPNP